MNRAVVLADDAAPNSSVAAPSIFAVPLPLTLPFTARLPPFAHSSPEFATSLCTASPPAPVASSVPELTTVFVPVSISSALVPLAMMVPSLTSAICPAPSWPAPEMVLSTLVRVASPVPPKMTL